MHQAKSKFVSKAEKNAKETERKQVRGILKLLILKELEKSDATGYDLIQRISTRTCKKPSTGSVYPLLKELANSGFLNVRVEGNKKIYSLSQKGKAVLEETSKREKEAILRKIEVLKSSGIMSEDEASNIVQFISMKRELWSKLFELRNWVQFLNTIAKAVEKSKSEVEEILDEAIKKLEGIE
jgi:DNA-binding PadR family transcriptional regulator